MLNTTLPKKTYRHPQELETIKLARAFGFLYEGEVWGLFALALSLPGHAWVVNIGAGTGTSALAVLEARPDLCGSFTTVDISPGGPLGGLQNERNAFQNAGMQIGNQILGDSKTVPWPHGPLDFVFVDGDHSRAGIEGDIAAWRPRVRPGGIMAFHDYHRDVWPEVALVVDERMADCSEIFTIDTLKAVRLPRG